MKITFLILFILLISLTLFWRCSIFQSESSVNELVIFYEHQYEKIKDELIKNDKDYIIFELGIPFTPSLTKKLFVFTKTPDGMQINKYGYGGKYPNTIKTSIVDFFKFEKIIKSVPKDTIIEELQYEDLYTSYYYIIDARISNKYYFFDIYSEAKNKVQDENLLKLISSFKEYLFNFEIKSWGYNSWGKI